MWTMNPLDVCRMMLTAQVDWPRMVVGLGGVIALFVVPYMLASWLANLWRAREYRTRLFLILFSIAASVTVIVMGQMRLGVDLKGGVILVYQVDLKATHAGAQLRSTEGANGEAKGSEKDKDQAAPPERGETVDMGALVEALKRRVNPDGLKEIVIRPFGASQVEIIVPKAEGAEIEDLKRKIATAGVLNFRIVANSRDHAAEIALAEKQLQDPLRRKDTEVLSADGKRVVARWVRVGRDTSDPSPIKPLKVDVTGDIIRDAATGERITNIPPEAMNTEKNPKAFEQWLDSKGIKNIEVLMIEPRTRALDVTGEFLGVVRSDFDENLNPCVNFTMRGEGAGRMSALTSLNAPEKDPPFYRRLGIVLDNELLSAPRIMSTIADRGRITGKFTPEEVDFLVSILRAGKLPAVLEKVPISQNEIGPMLGAQTIRQGGISIALSLVVVLAFVWFYYRWAGLVACMALVLNLLMTLALMMLLRASLTLPGLAGLVLTVGMSVDANVLIFERIREERQKGAALRMAIRNGFSRATTTIVDANLTTLLTGIILYAIGTDQVRGFAVTLILGILMSMFTAIYCARAVFDIAERNAFIKDLRMRDLVGNPQIDFMSKEFICATGSIVLIVLGMLAVFERGSRIFDVDISGGVSVAMLLKEPETDSNVRAKLDEAFKGLSVDGAKVQYSLHHMTVQEYPTGTVWKVDSSFQDVDALKNVLAKSFNLVTYSMEFTPPKLVTTSATAPADSSPAPSTSTGGQSPSSPPAQDKPADDKPAEDKPADDKPAEDKPAEDKPAEDKPAEDKPAEDKPADAKPADDKPADDKPADDKPADDATALFDVLAPVCELRQETTDAETTSASSQDTSSGESKEGSAAAEAPAPGSSANPESPPDSPQRAAMPPEGAAESSESSTTPFRRVASESTITFKNKVEEGTLLDLISQAAEALDVGYVPVTLTSQKASADEPDEVLEAKSSKVWKAVLGVEPDVAEKILAHVRTEINQSPVWVQASVIGGQVAGDTQEKAIAALIASLLGIIAYIWVRFQRVVFGLAAVLALVHDVLITLGAFAVSHYLVGIGSFLLIEEFKISLPVVAAFMTLIGYSLNDTIVVFDRIREVRGKSPQLTREMINTSINQTLSRTLLTSGTTLIVILILYFLGGEGIHAFAFTLLFGIIVGTYSSVFIASPALLWMTNWEKNNAAPARR